MNSLALYFYSPTSSGEGNKNERILAILFTSFVQTGTADKFVVSFHLIAIKKNEGEEKKIKDRSCSALFRPSELLLLRSKILTVVPNSTLETNITFHLVWNIVLVWWIPAIIESIRLFQERWFISEGVSFSLSLSLAIYCYYYYHYHHHYHLACAGIDETSPKDSPPLRSSSMRWRYFDKIELNSEI